MLFADQLQFQFCDGDEQLYPDGLDCGVGVDAKIFAYWMLHADIVARMPGLTYPLASGARVSRSDVFSEAG
jgi:hypothetical protein